MGLINKAQQQPSTSPTMPVEEQAPAQEVEGLKERASREPLTNEEDDLDPQEREAYDSAIKMASEMLYASDEANSQFMTQMKSGAPEESIPDVVAFVIEQIEMTFQGQLPEGIILPLADEISDIAIELADTAGIIKGSEELAKTIKTNTVQVLVEEYGATEEQMQEAMQGVSGEELEQIQAQFGGM